MGMFLSSYFALKPTRRSTLHHLIVNMAVSDILVVITFVYKMFGSPLPDNINYIPANIICKLVLHTNISSELVTLVSLLIISIERYRITSRLTVQAPQALSSKKRVLVVLSSWFVSMLLGLFALIVGAADFRSMKMHRCFFHFNLVWHVLYPFKNICAVIMYCSITILGILTSVRLSKMTEIQANIPDAQRRLRKKRMVSAVRMVLCSLLLYSCCYLPDLVQDISSVGKNPKKFKTCSDEIMMYMLSFPKIINSCLSPCIYLVFLSDFREAAVKVLTMKARISPRLNDPENTRQEDSQDTRL